MISWRDTFPSGSLVWLLLVAILAPLLATIGYALLLSRSQQSMAAKLKSGLVSGIPVIASELLLCWGLWIYSLSFAPSWGTVPEVDPNDVRPMMSLQEMMAVEDAKEDIRNSQGRGGVVGSGKFLQFEFVFPMAGAEGPHFTVRRPNYHVPHILEFLLRWGGAWMILFPLWFTWRQRLSAARAGVLTILWATIVYAPVAHAVWGDGWLEHMGTVDTGGGITMLAMSAAILATVRRSPTPAESDHADLLRLNLGALLLLAAWSLYFAGLMFRADARAAMSIVNTLLGTASTIVVWNICNRLVWKRPTWEGLEIAIVVGVATMASASAVVLPQSSMITGGFAGLLTSFWHAWCRRADDEVSPLRYIGFGAIFGLLATGIFATSNAALNRWDGRPVAGLLEGNTLQVQWQLAGAGASLVWSFVVSWILFQLMSIGIPRPVLTASEQDQTDATTSS